MTQKSMTQKSLSFSSPACEAMIVDPADEFEIKDKCIVINVSDVSIDTDNITLAPWRSGSETYMAPGYTHESFCDADLKYPWHQYTCISDSVWLAIEFY